jgi:hypothetical protein
MRLKPTNPALAEARTIHPKSVKDPADHIVIKSVANNSKLGKGHNIITKGPWRGMPLYSITLQERATCPTDCHHWADCYGNNMAFANRFEHGAALENKIMAEVDMLSRRYSHFAIRLHVLGDFYSTGYVMMWNDMLRKYPGLHIYGYTARHQGDIAAFIYAMNSQYPQRCIIRTSRNVEDKGDPWQRYAANHEFGGDAITCPEQLGKTESCLTCGLCFHPKVTATIKFLAH